MALVAEDQRMAELQRLGASVALLQLAAGVCIHAAFGGSCLGPPYYVYHGAGVPDGPAFVPLWDHCSRVCGMRRRPDGVEFIEFSIEAPRDFKILATTEQGFWASRFDFFYECEVPNDVLRAAADAVGFRFLDRYLAEREEVEADLNTFSAHHDWLRDLVARIDQQTTQA
jgi:hypothetical protein